MRCPNYMSWSGYTWVFFDQESFYFLTKENVEHQDDNENNLDDKSNAEDGEDDESDDEGELADLRLRASGRFLVI